MHAIDTTTARGWCSLGTRNQNAGVLQRPSVTVTHLERTRSPQKAAALAAVVAVLLTRRARVPTCSRRSGTATQIRTGSLLVLCGPSGVGKSTLVKRLLSNGEVGQRFGLVVSHTTRQPRDAEVDGVDYHFVSRHDMEQMIAEGKFLEHADVHGNLYGTSFAAIEDICSAGQNCVLDIDVEGVKSLKAYLAKQESKQDSYFVEVLPEGGIATLEARLRSRGVDDEAGIQRRLATARQEMKEYGSVQWDSTILSVEGDLDRGAQELCRVATRLVGMPESSLAEDDEPLESPDPVQDGPTVQRSGAPTKSVFGEFSGLARMLGSSCVDLGQGFPNFDPPEFVVKALRDELDGTVPGAVRTRHQYTRTAGHVTLVEALAERYSGHLGRSLDAMKEVAVTVGATNALFLAMQAALARPGAGREIVALEPFFELYRSQARGLNAEFRSVALRFVEESRCFELDVDALEEALGPQTAALIVNTPHNPTGKAFEEWELKAIAKLVQKHPHLLVISDEVYKYMIFDPPSGGLANEKDSPAGHIHFAKLPGMWEKTLTVSSAGKTFGITGWQIGWLIGPSEWMEPIQRFMPNLQFCAPTLTQRALCRVLREAAEPFHGAESYYEWLRQDYARRRDIMVAALEAGGIKTARSQGGFFLLGDISGLCGPEGPLHESWEASLRPDEARDWTCCRALAAEIGIVSLPVSPFFGAGSDESIRTRFARFCFAKTDATLEEAATRLASLA